MKIAITGINGQLGNALKLSIKSSDIIPLPHSDLDITDQKMAQNTLMAIKPDVVIHCAAMTNVDDCTHHPKLAYSINALGTRNLSLACADCNATMIYISTNEVFDGAATQPYYEWDPTHPINVYGQSKAAGEWFVSHLLSRFYIVRTAWLYSDTGSNFLHRILRTAQEGMDLHVVNDEVSNPTYVQDLADGISALIHSGAYGIYHLTNSGFCSRYDFAREILRIKGLNHVCIEPITQDNYPRASTPPKFAPLANVAADSLNINLRSWQEALEVFLKSHQI